VEAVARLKTMGHNCLLVTRGGIEPHGGEVMQNARALGLTVKDVRVEGEGRDAIFAALDAAMPADILNLRFFVPPWLLQAFQNAADGVLANSGHEPFGLVGLETMAAGGIAYTGSTGEDYAIPLDNAVVLETDDPAEIADYCLFLQNHPDVARSIREEGKRTAWHFRWEEVIGNMMSKLSYLSQRQGLSWNPGFPSSDIRNETHPQGGKAVERASQGE
jgi:glycosyltransferase involved in cell wall biosynthesis